MNKRKINFLRVILPISLVLVASCNNEIDFDNSNALENSETEKKSKLSSLENKSLPVIAFSDTIPGTPTYFRRTTHTLPSGNSGFQIGVTDQAGGVINQIIIPGIGDIMGQEADKYGRVGQVAIRDSGHGGVYNPTQAGFNEYQGTPVVINTSADGKTLTMPRRKLATWHGDGKYDYTEWENIGPGSEKNDLKNADRDDIDESDLPGKQLTEVRSEWDYNGFYKDISGQYGINIGIIKHSYRMSFIRKAGHCINQHSSDISPLWKPSAIQNDISVNAPVGVYPGTDIDMNKMIMVWSLRHDLARWNPKNVIYRKTDRTWATITPNDKIELKTQPADSDGTAFMIADNTNRNLGKALCVYRPKTAVNTEVVIGVKGNNIIYTDSRESTSGMIWDATRNASMSKYGFAGRLKGMISRDRLDDIGTYAGEGVYEAYRNEVYILYGTPNEIITATRRLDNNLTLF
ncbi:hypothetical protein [Flavicella sediminum]|uniref:hypothetical protein n=1 Tax=Flavicella sediminum TaxID=2585141 RepID=UPI00111E68B8|nr:hypothetical protein [Flavicella sediminum]